MPKDPIPDHELTEWAEYLIEDLQQELMDKIRDYCQPFVEQAYEKQNLRVQSGELSEWLDPFKYVDKTLNPSEPEWVSETLKICAALGVDISEAKPVQLRKKESS